MIFSEVTIENFKQIKPGDVFYNKTLNDVAVILAVVKTRNYVRIVWLNDKMTTKKYDYTSSEQRRLFNKPRTSIV